LVELPEAKGRSGPAAKADEGERLCALAGKKDWLVALDERGQAHSSVEFARFIGAAQAASHDLLFVVGGDEGLAPEVVAGAKRVLSLSRMTLPHRLARLVLIEQVYRAFTVLKGEPYHK